MKLSLNQRMTISAIVILLLFITLTAAALNKAYKNSAKEALRETLNSQLFALMATAEVDFVGQAVTFSMPSDDLDHLLGLPSSGLYAQVIDDKNNQLWRSESHLGVQLPAAKFFEKGRYKHNKINYLKDKLHRFSYGVNWVIGERNIPLTFVITNDLSSYNQQIDEYRETLLFWLGAMAVFLLISQFFILRWGLSPIRQVVNELKKIETGEQTKIEQDYPQEVEFLSENINQLLAKELQQKKRYRDALGDLAHSLKTPLAVLQNSRQSNRAEYDEQIERMNSIIEYQLQKASTAGSSNLSSAIDMQALVVRINQSLAKVYRDKNIHCDINSSSRLLFKADEGDMMELFGNLLDNAYKWAESSIQVNLSLNEAGLLINIIDDGPGFPEALINALQQRGKRADESIPGHGIGLSIVNNIIESYQGELSIKRNANNNTDISVILK